MDLLFSEKEADKRIISSLMHTTQLLWRELEEKRDMLKLQQLNKQRNIMSKVMQDLQGAYYLVEEYEHLTEEVARDIIDHAEHDLTMVKNFLAQEVGAAPVDTTQITPGAPAQAPVDAAPAQPEQPAAPADQTLAAPVDPNQQVPAPEIQPAAPAEQPATPAVDPNAQPAPAVDPNQAQVQPDPNAVPPLQ